MGIDTVLCVGTVPGAGACVDVQKVELARTWMSSWDLLCHASLPAIAFEEQESTYFHFISSRSYL